MSAQYRLSSVAPTLALHDLSECAERAISGASFALAACFSFCTSFGGVLQLVCHLERRAVVHNPRAYPRHHGLTFLRMEDFDRMRDHVLRSGAKFLVRPTLRFANTAHEHQTFMVADPTGNVVEFKCYVRPENSY